MVKIKRALISVQDKTTISELAVFLTKKGIEVIATPGTQKIVEKAGGTIVDIASVTGGGVDWLGGRLKTVHPVLYASIIANRNDAQEMEQLKAIGGRKIDLVIADIPSPHGEKNPAQKGKEQKGDENKDVGRIHLVRAAAQCADNVAILVNSQHYEQFMKDLEASPDLTLDDDYLHRLASEAAEMLADHDIELFKELDLKLSGKGEFLAGTMFIKYKKALDLRYGENPHQRAAFFTHPGDRGITMADITQIKGLALSHNNLCDLDTAISIAREFERDVAIVVKHGNPTGVAIHKDPEKAFQQARDADKVAAFGSTVVLHFQVDKKTAKELTGTFIEVLAAPKYTDGALAFLKADKKASLMRVLEINPEKWSKAHEKRFDIRSALGGVLIQENDEMLVPDSGQILIATKRKPTRKELADLVMAWKICKHVRSNAIVLVKSGRSLGIGAGQMSRLDSLKIAAEKAGEHIVGSAMASDAYIPFHNVIEEAATLGITTIIEPGGSRRDDEIVAACDEHNISLCLTGMRHFKH